MPHWRAQHTSTEPLRSALFSQDLAAYLLLKHGLGQQLLQACVLDLQSLESFSIGDVREAELAAPEVITGL